MFNVLEFLVFRVPFDFENISIGLLHWYFSVAIRALNTRAVLSFVVGLIFVNAKYFLNFVSYQH